MPPPSSHSKTNRQELPSREADTPNCVPLQPKILTVNKLISFLPNLMLNHPTSSAKEPQTDSPVPQIMISLISRIPNNLVLKTWFQRVSHFVFLLQQFKWRKLPCPVTQAEAAVYSFPPFDSEVAARTVHCAKYRISGRIHRDKITTFGTLFKKGLPGSDKNMQYIFRK